MRGYQMITKFRCTGCGNEDMPCELTYHNATGVNTSELRCVAVDQDLLTDETLKNDCKWERVNEQH